MPPDHVWDQGLWDAAKWDARTADQASFVVSGGTVNLRIARRVVTSTGFVVLTGSPAGLTLAGALTIDASSGAILLAGQSADLIYTPAVGGENLILSASTGQIVLSGYWADLMIEKPPAIDVVGRLNFGRRVIKIANRW